MKRILSMLLAACTFLSVCVVLTACGGSVHVHSYKTEWTADDTQHWHACDGCDDVSDKAAHIWDEGEITINPTAEADGVKTFTCTACGQKKTEAVKYTADEEVFVDTNPVIVTDPQRGNLTKIFHDAKGRLTEIWYLEDNLEWRYPFLTPTYVFEYGDDGKLTYYKGSSIESEIAYNDDGTAYFTETTLDNITPFSLHSISYHTSGSVAEIAFYYGTQLQTDSYDELGRIISAAWTNADGSDGAYVSTYENNVQRVTLIQGGELYDAEIAVEYNADGNPLKQTMRSGVLSVVTKEWIYEGGVLVGINDFGAGEVLTLTYDSNGLLAKIEVKEESELTEYTVFTYTDDGSRLTEKKYDAENNYLESYTYTYVEGKRDTVTREKIERNGFSMINVYDAYENMISETTSSAWDGEYNGEGTKYYQEVYNEFDKEGREVLRVETQYIDINGVKTKWFDNTYRADYNVPENANYEWVRTDSRMYYFDAPEGVNGLTGDDIYLTEISYYKCVNGQEMRVDEKTGELLPTGVDKWRDEYGNYCEVADGVVKEIIYYQLYRDSSGRVLYFTADGVKTYVS